MKWYQIAWLFILDRQRYLIGNDIINDIGMIGLMRGNAAFLKFLHSIPHYENLGLFRSLAIVSIVTQAVVPHIEAIFLRIFSHLRIKFVPILELVLLYFSLLYLRIA